MPPPPPPPPPPDPRSSGLSLALLVSACGASSEPVGRDSATRDDREHAEAPSNTENTSAHTPPRDGTTPGADTGTNTGTDTDTDTDTDTEPQAEPSEPTNAPVPTVGVATGVPTLLPPDDGPLLEGTPTCRFREVGTSPSARSAMAPYAVRHADFARRTIYSWTTAEQIAELRADPTLLTRKMTSDGERGRAADVLSAHAPEDAFAALFERPEFERRRFGWSNPWATLLGWDTENYGNHLLEIQLSEDAWLASIIVGLDGRLTWAFADVDGNPIDPQRVLDTPERLAAAYFVDLRDQGCGTLRSDGALFREYFVFNEAMVESWSAYTEEIRQVLDASFTAIQALRAELDAAQCEPVEWCVSDWVAQDWADEYDGPVSMATLYLAALAFPNPQYQPYPENLDALSRALAQVPFSEPLRHDR